MSEESEPANEEEKPRAAKRSPRKSAKRISKKLVTKEDAGSGEAGKAEMPPMPEHDASPENKREEGESGEQLVQEDQPAASSPDQSDPTVTAAVDAGNAESGKRKRRRRRNRSEGGEAEGEAPRPPIRVDAEVLSKSAWKIYLAEISEEGVALVGDKDAKELARRCFRLAEIFLEERSRQCERAEGA